MKRSLKSVVFEVCANATEAGGINKLENFSLYNIEAFCQTFRLEHGHKVSKQYKDGSINRYLELYLKQYNSSFNK